MFTELPETFPQKDEHRKPALLGSLTFHIFAIS